MESETQEPDSGREKGSPDVVVCWALCLLDPPIAHEASGSVSIGQGTSTILRKWEHK